MEAAHGIVRSMPAWQMGLFRPPRAPVPRAGQGEPRAVAGVGADGAAAGRQGHGAAAVQARAGGQVRAQTGLQLWGTVCGRWNRWPAGCGQNDGGLAAAGQLLLPQAAAIPCCRFFSPLIRHATAPPRPAHCAAPARATCTWRGRCGRRSRALWRRLAGCSSRATTATRATQPSCRCVLRWRVGWLACVE